MYLTGAEPFAGTDEESFRTLVQRSESIISRENTRWSECEAGAGDEDEGGHARRL